MSRIFENRYFDEIELYDQFGVFLLERERGRYTYLFRTCDPLADSIELSGDFNMWSGLQMEHVANGIFEKKVESEISLDGTCYKYRIYKDGQCRIVGDSFARYSRSEFSDGSIIYTDDDYFWQDESWLQNRRKAITDKESFPLNIYELHLGSWKKRSHEVSIEGHLNYRDLAQMISEYVFDMGYTHISLLSFVDMIRGSYFSPSSVHGTPEDFKFFVDALHRSDIGVLIDFDIDMKSYKQSGAHSEELSDFYTSAAVFWLREFHIDGIKFNVFEDNAWCVDAINLYEDDYFEVANMLKKINLRLENEFIDCLKISGELPEKIKATNKITKGDGGKGLCFDFVLNQNWCQSLFEDKQNEQGIQKYKYGKLGYTLMCTFDERYILPITAKDVSSGRGSLISKMQGEYTEKFRKIKLLLTYMMLHPGRKSVFMGCEIGEMHEWEKGGQIEWFLTDYPLHKELKNHCRRLNKIYAENSALWANDNSWKGFEWYESKGLEQGIMCFARIGEKNIRVVGIFNFSENTVLDFSLYDMNIKNAKILLSTGYETIPLINENIDEDSPLDLPPISALVLQIQNLEE